MDEIRVNPQALTPAVRRPDQTTPATGANQATGTRTTAESAAGKAAEDLKALFDTARIAGQPAASLAEVLPVSILQSPQLMRTEWAWRRLVIEAWMRQQSGGESGTSGTEAPTPKAEVLQGALESLWQHMDYLSQAGKQAPATLQWSGELPLQPLASHAGLNQADAAKLPEQHKAGIVLDRLQGAAATPTDPRTGSGLFFPGLILPQLPPGEARKAVRWEAERHTRITKTGQIVYRLKLNIEVAGRPVEMTFLSAKPSLSIHIRTPNEHLRRRIDEPDADITSALRQLGWHIDNWSTSDEVTGQNSSDDARERQGG